MEMIDEYLAIPSDDEVSVGGRRQRSPERQEREHQLRRRINDVSDNQVAEIEQKVIPEVRAIMRPPPNFMAAPNPIRTARRRPDRDVLELAAFAAGAKVASSASYKRPYKLKARARSTPVTGRSFSNFTRRYNIPYVRNYMNDEMDARTRISGAYNRTYNSYPYYRRPWFTTSRPPRMASDVMRRSWRDRRRY